MSTPEENKKSEPLRTAHGALYHENDITKCEYVNHIGLMFVCDELFQKNGVLIKQSNTANEYSVLGNSTKRPKSILVNSEDLLFFIKIRLPVINKKFILVTAGNMPDLIMPFEVLTKEQTRILLNNKFLVKWYVQNLLFIHKKMDNWPIGFSFNLIREGRTYETSAVSQELYLKSIISEMLPFYMRVADPEKDPLIYVNMSMRNSRLESRWGCFNAIYLNDPSLLIDIDTILPKLETGTETPRDEVWVKTSKSPFCLSPFGYGIDCHRTYEILALGAIPIIRGRILHRLYTDMPVLYVEKWEDVTRSLLIKTLKDFSTRKFDYSRLKIKYWSELLRSF